MRCIVQGPKPTVPAIDVAPVVGSGSQLVVELITPSDGPAPPYTYELEEALTSSGPWTTIATGAVFEGSPPVFTRDGLAEGVQRFYRARAIDNASPRRMSAYSNIDSATTFDITPADIPIQDITDWPTETAVFLQFVVAGITTSVPFSVSTTAGSVGYALSASMDGPFQTAPTTVTSGQFITVRLITPAEFEALSTVTITIGSRQFTWHVTTEEEDVHVFLWPLQNSNGQIHALPGVNTYGSNSFGGSGRDSSTTGVDIVLVTSMADSEFIQQVDGLGPGVYEGTLEGALEFDNGNRAKQIVMCVGGYLDYFRKGIRIPTHHWSLWGQFAPAPGFWTRGLRPIVTGHDWQWWHFPFYLGEQFPSSLPDRQEDGDPIRISEFQKATNFLFVNCEFSRCTDELVDAFHGMDNGGFMYCAFLEAVGYFSTSQGRHRTQYGPLFGGSVGTFPASRLAIERCLFAHNTTRNPWTAALDVFLANNLWYNCGRLIDGEILNGNGPTFTNQRNFSVPLLANVLNGMIVRGPDNSSILAGIEVHVDPGAGNAEFPAGSGVYIAGLVQNGWSNPASQAGYIVRNQSDVFGFVSSVRTQALPQGRDPALNDIYKVAANPNAPTLQEKLAFYEIMRASVGVLPAHRTTAVGRVENTFNQILARLNGDLSSTRQLVKNSAEAGGWWEFLPTVHVNPSSPGAHWHAPLPTASNRHTPYTDGFFSNGLSRAGYTPMEVWAIEQHYFVGGQ